MALLVAIGVVAVALGGHDLQVVRRANGVGQQEVAVAGHPGALPLSSLRRWKLLVPTGAAPSRKTLRKNRFRKPICTLYLLGKQGWEIIRDGQAGTGNCFYLTVGYALAQQCAGSGGALPLPATTPCPARNVATGFPATFRKCRRLPGGRPAGENFPGAWARPPHRTTYASLPPLPRREARRRRPGKETWPPNAHACGLRQV